VIGLQETMREKNSINELNKVGGNKDFVSNWAAANGHSGGILLGIKQDLVEVGAFDDRTFFVSALLRSRKDGFNWEMVVVYGLAQHGKSEEFLEELAGKCSRTEVPMVTTSILTENM
jgi:hypothetical protein